MAPISCRRCRRATYTVTFTLAGMQTVTRQGRGPARRDTAGDATLGVAGVSESGDRHRRSRALIDKASAAITSGISNDQISEPAGRHGVSRPDQADPRRAVHAGPVRGPSAGAAARTTSTSSTASTSRCRCSARCRRSPRRTTSRRSRSSRAARKAIDFNRAGGFDDRLGQQVGHQHVHRPGRLPLPERTACRRSSTTAARRAYDQDRGWTDLERRRPDRARTTSSSTARTTGPTVTAQQRVDRLRRRCPNYDSDAQRRLRQADAHADALDAGQRQLPRLAAPRQRHAVRPVHGRHGGHRQRGVAEDRHRRRIVDHQRDAAT